MQAKIPILLLFLLASPAFPQHKHISTQAHKHSSQSDWDFYKKQGHTSSQWDPLVEAGLDTFEGGNLDTSRNFLERALALGCRDALVRLKLAQIIELKGNLKGALALYQTLKPEMEKKYPKHPETKGLAEHLGRLHYQLEQYDKALPHYLEAIEKNGENFERLFLAGQIFRMQQKDGEAIDHFEKALQQKPPFEAAMVLLASLELMRLYVKTDQLDKALDTANAILEADPANAEAINLRDQIRREKYRQEEHKTWERILNK